MRLTLMVPAVPEPVETVAIATVVPAVVPAQAALRVQAVLLPGPVQVVQVARPQALVLAPDLAQAQARVPAAMAVLAVPGQAVPPLVARQSQAPQQAVEHRLVVETAVRL